MIKHTKQGWKVMSHTTGRSFGNYPSKGKAEARLRQIKLFGQRKIKLNMEVKR